MGRQACLREHNFEEQKGFALAEVIVALFFVTMAVMLVGGLSQQVMNLSKSSKQTSAIIELRSRVIALTRNSDDWVHKMRVDPNVGSIYSGCIPDESVVTTSFNCPPVDASILAGDAELSRIAGSQMHAARVPLVDSMGEQIAGGDEPVYLNPDGQPCTQEPKATQCTFESTGYMLRTNSASNSNPGNIRFVVKVARNMRNIASRGMTAMKPQYMSIDVGTQWAKTLTGSCPAGSLKMGYLSSGRPYCVKTMASCPSGQLALGINSSGAAICSSPPSTCPAGESAAYDPSSETIKCTAAISSGCPAGKVFLGFYAGSQQAICMSADMSCPAGEVQVGFTSSASSVQASCAQVPTCSSSQVVAFNGNAFVCSTESEGVSCAESQVLVGITKAGAPLCEPLVAGRDGINGVDGKTIAVGQTCNDGEFVAGINNDGSVLCRSPASADDSSTENSGSLGQFELPSFATGSNSAEKQKAFWPTTCSVISPRKVYPCTYLLWGGEVESDFRDGSDKTKNPTSLIPTRAGGRNAYLNSPWYTHRTCMYLNGQWRVFTGRNSTNTKNIYGRICTGGVTYERAASPMSLAGEYYGHPADESSVSVTGLPSYVIARPSKTQFLEFLSQCPDTTAGVDSHQALSSEEKNHCKNYINAKASAERAMSLLSDKSLEPMYCRYVSNGTTYVTDLKAGGGVKFSYVFKLNSANKVISYVIRYRWARNYAFIEGSVLPTGNDCNASGSAFPYVEAILAVPPPPRSSDFDDVE